MVQLAGLMDTPVLTMRDQKVLQQKLAGLGGDDYEYHPISPSVAPPAEVEGPQGPAGRLEAASIAAQEKFAKNLIGLGDMTGIEALEDAGNYLTPEPERLDRLAERHQIRAEREEAGELTPAGAITGAVLDGAAAEVPSFATAMASAWAGGKTGAAMGARFGPQGAAVGGAVGSIVGGLSPYLGLMFEEALEEGVRVEHEKARIAGVEPRDAETIRNDPEVRDNAYGAAAVNSLMNTVVPLRAVARMKPGLANDIAREAVLKRGGKEMTKDAFVEGSTEVAEKAVNAIVMDPEMLNNLTEGELDAVTTYLGDRLGNRETAIEFLTGALVGGTAGGLTGMQQQRYENAKIEADGNRLEQQLKPLGLTKEKVDELAATPEGVAQIRQSMEKLGTIKQQHTTTLRDLETGLKDGSITAEDAEATRNDIHREELEVVDGISRDMGLPMTLTQVEAEAADRLKQEKEAAVETLQAYGIRDPKGSAEEVIATANKLKEAEERVEKARDRMEAVADPTRRAEEKKKLDAALHDQNVANIEALRDRTGLSPSKAVAQANAEKRRKSREERREAAVQAQIENEFPDDMDDGARKAKAEEMVGDMMRNPNADQKGLDKKIERLIGQRRRATTPEQIDKINEQIADLEARRGLPTPALEAARRVLQDLGGPSEEPEVSRPEVQPGLAAALDAQTSDTTGTETEASPASEAEVATPAPTGAQAKGIRLGLRRGRGQTPTNLLREATPAERKSLLETADRVLSGDVTSTLELEKFSTEAAAAGFTDKRLPTRVEGEVSGEQAAYQTAAALVTARNEMVGTPSTELETRSGAIPSSDPRREGYDGFKPWRDLVEDVGVEGTREDIEAAMRGWTRRFGKEAAAHFAEDGTLLGVGTNDMENGVTAPRQGFADPTVTFSHTHPVQTPFSAGDVRAMMIHRGPFRAIMPDGQTIEMRPLRVIPKGEVTRFQREVMAPVSNLVDPYMAPVDRARVRQEAFLRILEDEGIIEYTQPLQGLTEEEQDIVANIQDEAAASDAGVRLRRRADEREGTGSDGETGGRSGSSTTSGPEALATPEARASRESRVSASPIKVNAIADTVVDAYLAPRGRGQPKNLAGKVWRGEISRNQIRAAVKVLVNGVGNKSNFVLRDASYAMYPELKDDPITSTYVVGEGKEYRGQWGKQQYKPNPVSLKKFNSVMNLINDIRIHMGDDYFFYLDPRFVKRKRSNQYFQAYILDASTAMRDFIDYQGSPVSALLPPMEDPENTDYIVKKPDQNAMTDEQMEPGKRTARHFQANVYTVDEARLADLKPIDLISAKGIRAKGIKKDRDFPKAERLFAKAAKSPKRGITGLSKTDQEWVKRYGFHIQDALRTAETKLDRFRTSYAEHKRLYPGEPIGFQYQIDNKGRIYADGDLNPQTSDAVKAMFMVDGVSLKDMESADASASGWQIAALMARDATLAPNVNMGGGQASIEGYQKKDMYEDTIARMEELIADDLINGNAEEKRHAKFATQNLRDENGNALLDRNLVKTPIIALNYAATERNMREHFREALTTELKTLPPGFANYLTKKGQESLRQVAPDTMAMQDWAVDAIAKTVAAIEQQGFDVAPVGNWTVGAEANYKRRKPKEEEARIKFRAAPGVVWKTDPNDPFGVKLLMENGNPVFDRVKGETVNTDTIKVNSPEVDANATARSIYSQIIQGFDASILHRTVERYKQETDGAFITTNHDAFTVPPEHVGTLGGVFRESMHRVMDDAGHIPDRIYQNIVDNLAAAGLTPEALGIQKPPALGSYNLDDIMTSSPLFTEDTVTVDGVETDVDLALNYAEPQLESENAELALAMDELPEPEVANARDQVRMASYLQQFPSAQTTLEKVQSTIFGMDDEPRAKVHQTWEDKFFNAFAPIRRLELKLKGEIPEGMDSAYKSAEIAVNDPGRNETLMYYGAASLDENQSFQAHPDTMGLVPIFQIAGGTGPGRGQQLADWQAWGVARRAQDLHNRGIKTPLTEADIQTGLALERPEFLEAAEEWRKFNNQQLNFLEETGRITREAKEAMQADEHYVPLYRSDQRMDGASPDLDLSAYAKKGVRGSDILSRDPGIRKIIGGDKLRVNNLIQNMVKNSQAMAAAGMRNLAANKMFDLMEEAEMATIVDGNQKKPHPNAMQMWKDGQEKWVIPTSEEAGPVVLALSGLQPVQLMGIMKTMADIGSLFRQTITLMPPFMLRNLVRGTVSTGLLTSGANMTAQNNVMTGMADALRNGPATQAFKAQSGMGDYRFGNNDAGFGKNDILIDLGLKPKNAAYMLRKAISKAEHLGTATELADRIAAFNTMKNRGARTDEAAYQALAVMNYGRRGNSAWLRQLLPTVPFLNARLQGLSRLSEGAVGPRGQKNRKAALKQLALNGSLLVAASAGVWALANMDEEDRERYEAEPLHRRLNYHIFYVDGQRYLLPKAFELGHLFSTYPELLLNAAKKWYSGDGIEDNMKGFIKTLSDTVAFNAVPHGLKAALELGTNYNFHTGRPIEGRRDESRMTRDRTSTASPLSMIVGRNLFGNTGVSDLTHWAGQVTGMPGLALSPNEIEHLIRNFGTLAGTGTSAATAIVAQDTDLLTGGPSLAAKQARGVFGDVPFVTPALDELLGSFTSNTDLTTDRYTEDAYRLFERIENRYNSAKDAAKDGDAEYVEQIVNGRTKLKRAKKAVNKARHRMTELNAELRAIRNSRTMSRPEKVKALTIANGKRNALARKFTAFIDKLETEQKVDF